jgi:transposase InsO family protein
MKELYEVAGITKQAIWKYRKRQQQVTEMTHQVIQQMEQIRQHHRRMSCRKMYYAVPQPVPIGRDQFEQIGFANGFKLKRKVNPLRTTWSQRIEIHPNLIEGKTINGINQIWQSDIFHLSIEQKPYYGFTIQDIYTRELLALHLCTTLEAEQLTIAFRKAIKMRKGTRLGGCIFHSDRGSQYISRVHKQMIRDYGMKISMGKLPQENAYVERLQGILKQEYLLEDELTTNRICAVIPNIIHSYNHERPHSSLNMMNPAAFRNRIQRLPKKHRPQLTIHQGFVKNKEKNHLQTMWKSGKKSRLFSKEVFSAFPHCNRNHKTVLKSKSKRKSA